MNAPAPVHVREIAIEDINVLNPRSRRKNVFAQVVDSVSKVGLKRPITVSPSHEGCEKYDLVCGQGRIEAYLALGQTTIPAIVRQLDQEACLVMSLVENIARRKHGNLELLQSIRVLADRGYESKRIASKTGLSCDYVHGITNLLERGEDRLILAVEAGDMPISLAIEIAETDDAAIQDAVTRAYESGELRGKKLLKAKRLLEHRRQLGKKVLFRGVRPDTRRGESKITTKHLVTAYQNEADKQRETLRRAELAQSRLSFIVEALRALLADENFVTLLRAEQIMSMPQGLHDLLVSGREGQP